MQLKLRPPEFVNVCNDGAPRPRRRDVSGRTSENAFTRGPGLFSVKRPDRLQLSSVAYFLICVLFVRTVSQKKTTRIMQKSFPMSRWLQSLIHWLVATRPGPFEAG